MIQVSTLQTILYKSACTGTDTYLLVPHIVLQMVSLLFEADKKFFHDFDILTNFSSFEKQKPEELLEDFQTMVGFQTMVQKFN